MIESDDLIIKRLKELKAQCGLTNREIADLCKTSESTIKHIFAGSTTYISLWLFKAMVAAMGGKCRDFFDEDINFNLVPDSPAVLQDPQPVIIDKAAGDLAAVLSPIKYATFRSILDLDDLQCLDVLREIARISAEKAAIQKEKEN